MPDTATDDERALVERLAKSKGVSRGTLRTQLAVFADGAITITHMICYRLHIVLGINVLQPKSVKKSSDLRKLPHSGIYRLLLCHAQTRWPHLNVVDDFTAQPHTTPMLGSQCAKVLPFIYKEGIRYGSHMDRRTQADRFACVDFEGEARVPCRLLYHFALSVGTQDPILCSAVQRLVCDEHIPLMPWSL